MQSLLVAAGAVLLTTGVAGADVALGRAGTMLLAGDFEFTVADQEIEDTEERQTTLGVGPSFSYFVIDGLALGLAPAFVLTETTNEPAGEKLTKRTTDVFRGSATAGYYFPISPSRALQLHIVGSVGYFTGTTKNETSGRDTEVDVSGVAFGGLAGLLYALGEDGGGFLRLAFAVTRLSGDAEAEDESAEMKITEFGVVSGLGVFF